MADLTGAILANLLSDFLSGYPRRSPLVADLILSLLILRGFASDREALLKSSAIFGLSEPTRAYLRPNQSQQFNCVHTLAPTWDQAPKGNPQPLCRQFSFRRIRVYSRHSFQVMLRDIFVLKGKLDFFTGNPKYIFVIDDAPRI